MAEEIHSVTSSEWKLVQQRLDDLENLVTDLQLKLEILGECKCNRSNSHLETQHSDDEETESLIGLNAHSNSISSVSGILGNSGQSTFQLDETMASVGRDASNCADSTATLTTASNSTDNTSLNTDDNREPVFTKSALPLSNGIGTQDIEKDRRLEVKLRRFDQVEVTGTSSTSEFRMGNNKSTLTSTNRESHLSTKKPSVHRRKSNGVRAEPTSASPSSGEKRFVCNFCSKRFGSKSHLTVHVRVHTGSKPFHCNTCSKKFNIKSNLTRHTRVHTGGKPFKCGFCSKKFSHKDSLTGHTRLHTGDKPFGCAFCSKKFNQSQSLVIHVRSHTGERPFVCRLCSKTFATHSTMRMHLKVHTREKSYLCPSCPKVFAHSSSLNLHLKKHPGETLQRQGQIPHDDAPGSQPS